MLKDAGLLADYEAELAVIEDLYVALYAYVTADQFQAIVNVVYNAVIDGEITNAEIRALVSFVYFDILQVSPAARAFALRAAAASLSAADKIAVIQAVYTVLKNHGYINVTPEIQIVETLYNDLTEAKLLSDEQILNIFDKVVVTFVENETITKEKITKVVTEIATDILLSDEISTENKLAILDKISGALSNSNINIGITVPTIPALPVIQDIQLALKNAGLLSDETANKLLAYVYDVVMSGAEFNNEQLIAIAKNVYTIAFEKLTAEQKAEVVRIIYVVLEDHGYISQEIIMNALIEAVDMLKKLVPQYYNEAYEYGYYYAVVNGYLDMAINAIDSAIAAINGINLDAAPMTEITKANLYKELAATIATLQKIKAALANNELKNVQGLINTVLALEEDLNTHLANIKVLGHQAGINVYNMVILPQVEIVHNEAIPALQLAVYNILQQTYKKVALKVAEVYGIVIDVNATAEDILAAIRAHVAHIMAGELTVSKDTFYLAIVDGDDGYADLVAQALNLRANQYKKVTMSEVTAEDIARATFITVGYSGMSAIDFALEHVLGFAGDYVNSTLRVDFNEYLAKAFGEFFDEETVDSLIASLNVAMDGVLADYLVSANKFDWADLVGKENVAYVNKIKQALVSVLAKAGVPETYYYTIDVVDVLYANAESFGLELILNFEADFIREMLGENAYYTLAIPAMDALTLAVEAALYEFISYNVEYSKTMLAIAAINPDAVVAVLGNYNRFDIDYEVVINEVTFTLADVLAAFGINETLIPEDVTDAIGDLLALNSYNVNVSVAEIVEKAMGKYYKAIDFVLSLQLPIRDDAKALILALINACNTYLGGFAGQIIETDVYTISIPVADLVTLVLEHGYELDKLINASLNKEIVLGGVTIAANDALDTIASFTSIHPFLYAVVYRNVFFVDISDAKLGGIEYIAAQILNALTLTFDCVHDYDDCEDTDCNLCGAERDPGHHDFTDYVSNGDATCTEDGISSSVICSKYSPASKSSGLSPTLKIQISLF